jgi:hypothetical protein
MLNKSRMHHTFRNKSNTFKIADSAFVNSMLKDPRGTIGYVICAIRDRLQNWYFRPDNFGTGYMKADCLSCDSRICIRLFKKSSEIMIVCIGGCNSKEVFNKIQSTAELIK